MAERRRVREETRPDEERGVAESETPEVGDGETKGDLETAPAGAPTATAAFSEREGDSAVRSRIEI